MGYRRTNVCQNRLVVARGGLTFTLWHQNANFASVLQAPSPCMTKQPPPYPPGTLYPYCACFCLLPPSYFLSSNAHLYFGSQKQELRFGILPMQPTIPMSQSVPETARPYSAVTSIPRSLVVFGLPSLSHIATPSLSRSRGPFPPKPLLGGIRLSSLLFTAPL